MVCMLINSDKLSCSITVHVCACACVCMCVGSRARLRVFSRAPVCVRTPACVYSVCVCARARARVCSVTSKNLMAELD